MQDLSYKVQALVTFWSPSARPRSKASTVKAKVPSANFPQRSERSERSHTWEKRSSQSTRFPQKRSWHAIQEKLLMRISKLLKSVTPDERRQIFMHRLSQEQKLELELFMAKECARVARDACKNEEVLRRHRVVSAEKIAGPEVVGPRRFSPEVMAIEDEKGERKAWPRKPKPRGWKRKMQGVATTGSGYEAYIFVDWLLIKWKKLKCLEDAIDIHILLTTFAEQMRLRQSFSIKERILQALQVAKENSQNSSTLANSSDLCFKIQIPSTHWTGRQLMTPTFQMCELDLVAHFWVKLREARGYFSGRVKIGGKGMLYRMTPAEMDDTWSRVRSVYLEIKANRGHDEDEAARKINVMVAQRAPFREQVWQAWNLTMMRKAEKQQRPFVLMAAGMCRCCCCGCCGCVCGSVYFGCGCMFFELFAPTLVPIVSRKVTTSTLIK